MKLVEKIKNCHKMTLRSMRTYDDKNFYNHSYLYIMKLYEYACKKNNEWKKKGVLYYRNCPVCNSKETSLILEKNIDCCKYSRCLNCYFVYANPFTKEDYYNEIYINGYDGLLDWWDEIREKYGYSADVFYGSYPQLDMIKRKKKSGVFLDFGCGTGWVLDFAKNYYDVYGIELDNYRIKKARNRLGDIKGERVFNFHELDESILQNRFDIIHSNVNIEHLLDPMSYLKKFYRWLKPGGILYISAPASDSFCFFFLKESNITLTISHVSLFNKKSMCYALSTLGFKEIEFVHQTGLDVTATEFWRKLLNINFLHRHTFMDNQFLIIALYPIMFLTTIILHGLCKVGILKGNYFYVFAKKPEK